MIPDGEKVFMSLPIVTLPDCYARARLIELAYDENTQVIVVASAGYANDWSAYIGFPVHLKSGTPHPRPDLITFSGVASGGDKLDSKAAKFLFGNLFAGRSYRP